MTYIPPSQRGTCSSCGKTIQIGRSSSPTPRCRDCRHSYRRGCRCETCRAGNTANMREYVARRKADGNPIRPGGMNRACDQCGAEFTTRTNRPDAKFCSRTCLGMSQRCERYVPKADRDRFRVSEAFRTAIYERDGWACQICGEPVEPESVYPSSWYPTLDHIIPRSLGGSDDIENLRTAHHWCNAVRGNLTYHTDADLAGVA